jgi:peroxiredoxin (alkyl hydroperoxide reductase subunit C)
MTESTGLTLRGAFVINPEGQIKLCEIHNDGIGREAKELLRNMSPHTRVRCGQCFTMEWP